MIEFNFHPFPILQTGRLTLRRISMDDAEAIYKMRTDPQVTKYSDRFPPKDIEEIFEMIRSIENGINTNETIAWALSLNGDNELMGTVSFHKTYREHHRAEVGYQLLPQHWRKGFMTEALKAAIDYGFNTMKLHSFEAHINPNNLASARLLSKHGFIQEALFRENYYFNGKFLDTPVFSLVNKEN